MANHPKRKSLPGNGGSNSDSHRDFRSDIRPLPEVQFLGRNGATYNDSEAATPNVVLILLEDVGCGYPRTFGGAACVAETLKQNGYSTAAFGKWHITPDYEVGTAGAFDRRPTGLGFEHWWGFQGGEASQWHTPLYENTTSYQSPFAFTGKIKRVLVDICDADFQDLAAMAKLAMAVQ